MQHKRDGLLCQGKVDFEAVREMQQRLLQAGEVLPRWGADGDFGCETLAAVRSFQRKHQLVVDGICGPITWGKLEKVTA